MFAIECPRCGAQTSISLTESTYEGAFRCWKCKGAFIVIIKNEELMSWKSVSEEEFKKYIE